MTLVAFFNECIISVVKKHLFLGAVAVFNWGLSAYCGFAFFAFTSHIVIESEAAPSQYIPMEGGGLPGGYYRYGYCAVIALLLQGLLAILNLSVTQYIEPDIAASNRFCIVIAATSFLIMMALFSFLIGHNL